MRWTSRVMTKTVMSELQVAWLWIGCYVAASNGISWRGLARYLSLSRYRVNQLFSEPFEFAVWVYHLSLPFKFAFCTMIYLAPHADRTMINRLKIIKVGASNSFRWNQIRASCERLSIEESLNSETLSLSYPRPRKRPEKLPLLLWTTFGKTLARLTHKRETISLYRKLVFGLAEICKALFVTTQCSG